MLYLRWFDFFIGWRKMNKTASHMLSRTNSNGLLVFFKFMFNFDWTKKKEIQWYHVTEDHYFKAFLA